MGKGGRVHRRRATILADYSFLSTATVDSSFQFVDCSDASGFAMAKDIRVGVIPIENSRVIIALGNAAHLDQFSNVASSATAVVNALIERFGCVGCRIWVLGLLPRPMADCSITERVKNQNKSLFRSVRALIRRKQYPVTFVPLHKWLLKRVKHPDGSMETAMDTMYYEPKTDTLNEHGLAHLHLLLAAELQLRRIHYWWSGMQVVHARAAVHQVMEGKKHALGDKPGGATQGQHLQLK